MNRLFRLVQQAGARVAADVRATVQAVEAPPLPSGSATVQAFYSDLAILPQGQSPAQLAAWLSAVHPRYNMCSWCFFGNLTDDRGRTAAISSIVQYNDLPDNPPYVAEWSYCDERLGGYVLAPFLVEAGNVAYADPFAVTVDANPVYGGLLSLSLTEGAMGAAGARYRMTGRVVAEPDLGDVWTYELALTDPFGCIRIGYGPSSFLPQWLLPAQQAAVGTAPYDGDVHAYLQATGDALTGQGSYYYSVPLLTVDRFRILRNGAVYASGTEGNLWIDYVVQSFDPGSLAIVNTASWQFFAVQLPEVPGLPGGRAALMISIVEVDLPGGGTSTLPMAHLYYGDPAAAERNENGAHPARHEWATGQIHYTATKRWSPAGGKESFPVGFEIDLAAPGARVTLRGRAFMENQLVGLVGKYEGVFEVEADLHVGGFEAKGVRGFAWAEVH